MRAVWIAVLGACIAIPAYAHDFWLQPSHFWIAPRSFVPVSLLVGHGANRTLWDADINRVTSLNSLGPQGTVDLRGSIRQGGTGRMSFATPGVHVVSLQTGHSQSDLPALRFNDYLQTEGLTPAQEQRRRLRQTNVPGREIYSRRAKALVRVGPGPVTAAPYVIRPLGQTLELVPGRNPYAVPAGEALPFVVYYKGRPLQGALVKLTYLGADERPAATQRSNAAGRVAFTMPRRGAWQLNVVWTEPLTGHATADFDTTFASLTFGFDPSERRSQ